jgi:hypothetical protein
LAPQEQKKDEKQQQKKTTYDLGKFAEAVGELLAKEGDGWLDQTLALLAVWDVAFQNVLYQP